MLSKLVLASSLILASCKGIHFSEEDSYGLKLVTMDISPEEHGLLEGQLFSKRPVQVNIKIAGELKVYCRVSYAGRSSLDAYRKSYDLDFCNEKYNKRSAYRLSAQAIDKTMARSMIGYEVFEAAGLEVPKAELASAYLNKKYLGVYVFMENVDKEFYKAHKISIDQAYKARYGNASFRSDWASKPFEAFSYDGKGEDNFVLIQEIYRLLYNEMDDAAFAGKIEKLVDIDSFLSYMAGAVVLGHWDGFDNNYFLTHDTDKKKLITTPWDLDRIWEKPNENDVDGLISKNFLLVRILKNEGFQKIFVGKIQKLSSDFSADKLAQMLKDLEIKAKDAYTKDPILSQYQATAYVELESNIRAWDLKVKDYLTRNPL